MTYQNFISLNRFGRKLGADLILAYAGPNDFVVPFEHEHFTDVHYQLHQLHALALRARLGVLAGYRLAARPLPQPDDAHAAGLCAEGAAVPGVAGAAVCRAVPRASRRAADGSQRVPARSRRHADDPGADIHEARLRGTPIVLIWQAMHPFEMQARIRKYQGVLAAYVEREVMSAITGWQLPISAL